jgi:hypothetical protein
MKHFAAAVSILLLLSNTAGVLTAHWCWCCADLVGWCVLQEPQPGHKKSGLMKGTKAFKHW